MQSKVNGGGQLFIDLHRLAVSNGLRGASQPLVKLSLGEPT